MAFLTFRLLAVFVLLTAGSAVCSASERFSLFDADDNEIHVELMPADGDLIAVWFTDHEDARPTFDNMLAQLNALGVEVWRIDLLADYFLPRGNEQVRTLSGQGVRAVIEAAHARSGKDLLLAAYDRMPLPVLRGIRLWQEGDPAESRLLGAVLFYPNLYGPPPVAGELPELDPVVAATNVPVVVYQPEQGAHRWRLREVMSDFWRGGSPAAAVLVPEVRDWFFMHPPGRDPAETRATVAVPPALLRLAAWMEGFPKPREPVRTDADMAESRPILGLVPFQEPRRGPNFTLPALDGAPVRLADYRGRVVLLNFWATWCPPCVEEIPSMNALMARHRADQFAVVSVDYRETEETVKEFVERVPVDFPVLLDLDGAVSTAWNLFSFPSSFLLDREGRIRYSVNRAIDWNSPEVHHAVERLLAESR